MENHGQIVGVAAAQEYISFFRDPIACMRRLYRARGAVTSLGPVIFGEPRKPHLLAVGPEFNRRTVYCMNVNSGKEPLLDAFDCPDPSVKTPRRGVTTTPLQALALMNNSFVQRQAEKLAARVMAETRENLPEAIGAAYRHALGRDATRDELNRGTLAAKKRGLPHVCWALLNSTEFVYVQ